MAKTVKPNGHSKGGRPKGLNPNNLLKAVKPNPMGRATVFTPDIIDKAEKLAFLGLNDEQIQEFLDVKQTTWDSWLLKHVELRQRLREARVMALADVAAAMRKAAVGYTKKEVKVVAYKGDYVLVPVDVEVGPDTTAGFKILNSRAGDAWMPASRTEHTGAGGGPIEVAPVQVYLPDNTRDPVKVIDVEPE